MLVVTLRSEPSAAADETRACVICERNYLTTGSDGQAWVEAQLVGDVCPICMERGSGFITAELRVRASRISLQAQQKAIRAQQRGMTDVGTQVIEAEIAALRQSIRDGVRID